MKTLNLLNNKLLVFIFILTSFHCKAQWNEVYENDSIINLGMYFTSDSVGYVVGYRINSLNYQIGHVLKTTDGGNHWSKIYEGTPQTANPASYPSFRCVYFPTNQTGYVGGDFNLILKTTNAGQTWQELLLPFSPPVYDARLLYCTDSLTCFVGKAYLYKTFNGGLNWVVDSNASPLDDVSFPTPNKGFGIWSNTSDGGQNWSTFQFPNGLAATYRCIDFLNESLGWVGGSSQDGSPNFNFGTIAKTSDGGISWQQKDFQYEMLDIRDIVFINDSVGWACGAGQSGNSRQILKTIDGGLNWHKQFLNYTTNYSAVTQMQCLNDTLCYAISGWQIFKTTNGGGPMIELGEKKKDSDLNISIYPNPVEDKINFNKLKKGSRVVIYNSLGQIQLTYIFMDTQSLDISNLQKGIYLYLITDAQNVNATTGKFVKK